MKRLILTITIVLVLIGIDTNVANARINWRYIAQSEIVRHTSGGHFPRIGGCIGGSRINWRYIAQSEMIRHTSSRHFPGIGGYGRYGGYGYPSNNVRVRHNEHWGLQGGQRSYERSPDYLGKIIDLATTLGALAILSH